MNGGFRWWFSAVDVCGVLTDSVDAGAYWRKLKQRLSDRLIVFVCFFISDMI